MYFTIGDGLNKNGAIFCTNVGTVANAFFLHHILVFSHALLRVLLKPQYVLLHFFVIEAV